MTGHQINSLVGDLVAMAQAMERLPQVESELASTNTQLEHERRMYESLKTDLEQSRSYAATLEQKVRDAEVAKDAAETMFLEADERTLKLERSFQTALEAMDATDKLIQGFKPQPEPIPEPAPAYSYFDHEVATQANEIRCATLPMGEGQSVVDPTVVGQSTDAGISIDPSQGQSESNPIPANTSAPESGGLNVAEPSEPGPYHNRRYIDTPGWVSREDWLAGGGTNEDYDWRESSHVGF